MDKAVLWLRAGLVLFAALDRDEELCYFSGIRAGGPRSLGEGDKVEFSIEEDTRGPKAADPVVLEEGPRPADRWYAEPRLRARARTKMR